MPPKPTQSLDAARASVYISDVTGAAPVMLIFGPGTFVRRIVNARMSRRHWLWRGASDVCRWA